MSGAVATGARRLSPTGRAALAYATRFGWAVFPVVPGGKAPLTPHGFKDATREEAQIRTWWEATPEAGIGLPTGAANGVDVLDVDAAKDGGPGGEDSLRELLEQHGPLPDAPEVLTPGGGRHLYFQHAPGVGSPTGVLPGVDVRGDGGYVVVPPSGHPSGRTYAWELSGRIGEVEAPPWPPWLLELVAAPERQQSAPPQAAGPIPAGERNSALAQIAGRLRRSGLEAGAIEAALQQVNATRCAPPLKEAEVAGIAASVGRYPVPSGNGAASPGEKLRFALTDAGNAERLLARHGENMRFCDAIGGRLIWDGRRWAPDATGAWTRWALATVRGLLAEASQETDDERRAALAKHAVRSEARQRIEAMTALAECLGDRAVAPEQLDADPWLLNVANGTLDLRTGRLRPHGRGDLLTKIAPVDYVPGAACPTWQRCLDTWLGGDAELAAYVQRAVGYSLSGSTREQVLHLLLGTGANGKSVLLAVLQALLGDYGRQADFGTFLERRQEGPRNDLARLKGARLVVAAESGQGRALDEPTIKSLTGGDAISCRFLHREHFEYRPQFKLWLATNHLPLIRGADYAIWRRVRLVPFEVTISPDEQDPALLGKLLAELPGILAWAVEGFRQWHRYGLGEHPRVVAAVASYREACDALADFIATELVRDPAATTAAGELFAAYRTWAEAAGERPASQRRFGQMLTERGFQRGRDSGGRVHYTGARLKEPKE